MTCDNGQFLNANATAIDPLTLEEAADYLRLKPEALQATAKRGEVTHARLDYRNYRFRLGDLDDYLLPRTFKAKVP